jgi:hypothetical protein
VELLPVNVDKVDYVLTNFTGSVSIKKVTKVAKKVAIKKEQEFVDLVTPTKKPSDKTPTNTPANTTPGKSDVDTPFSPFSESDNKRHQAGVSIYDSDGEIEDDLDDAFQDTQPVGLSFSALALIYDGGHVYDDEQEEDE